MLTNDLHKDAIKILAERYSKDPRVINSIVSYPFKFTREVMSGDSERGIRFPYLGSFVLKRKVNKQTVAIKKVNILKKYYPDHDILHECLDSMLANKEYSGINKKYTEYYSRHK
jgi:hypothetical protein